MIILPIAMTFMAITALLGQYGATDLLIPALLSWVLVCALNQKSLAKYFSIRH
jgi:hypothetical protein